MRANTDRQSLIAAEAVVRSGQVAVAVTWMPPEELPIECGREGGPMPRRVLVTRSEQSFDLIEAPAPSEHHLQEVVKTSPQLIPADDLGLDGDLLVVGRETSLASGYIDLLCLARSGDLVLVEFKTGPQNPDFRHALAQAIDYGSDLWRLSVEDFDRGVVQRYLAGGRVDAAFRGARTLSEAIERTSWDLTSDDRTALFERLTEVLQRGDFAFVIAAQRFTDSMKNSLDYLNATMRRGRFYLVEVIQLTGAELIAHATQVVAAPARWNAARSTTEGARKDVEEAEYLSSIGDPAYRDAVRSIIARCETLGIEVKWRSRGAALRIDTPDRRQPLAIGWMLSEGSHWQAARYVTLGVDPTSLAQTPSVANAVLAYAERVKSIPGGVAPKSALNAATFPPAVLPGVLGEVDGALTALVEQLGA